MNRDYQKWDELAPRGLMLIGLGVSITGEAIIAKSKGRGFLRWFVLGVIGLVCINSGVSVFGEAVKHRALYDFTMRQAHRETPHGGIV